MQNWLVNWNEVESAFTGLAPRQDNYECDERSYDPRTHKVVQKSWCIKAYFNDLDEIMMHVNRVDVPDLDEARNWAYWLANAVGKTPEGHPTLS